MKFVGIVVVASLIVELAFLLTIMPPKRQSVADGGAGLGHGAILRPFRWTGDRVLDVWICGGGGATSEPRQ
jgi:hypothetical protein